jgi:hypothetical protein
MTRIPKAVAIRVALKAYDSTDHITAKTGLTLAIVISLNGAAFGNPHIGATNATAIGNGWYYVDLDTTDTGTEGPLIVRGTAAGADDVETRYQVVKATNGGWTGIPDAAADAPGGLPISDAGGLDLDTNFSTLASGELSILNRLSTIVTKTGTVSADAGNTALTFKTSLTEAVDDYYKDCLIKITSGTLKEQVKKIRAYNGTTKFVTVTGGFTSAPVAADAFEIVND